MARPIAKARQQQVTAVFQQDEPDRCPDPDAQPIAIASAQRRTGKDHCAVRGRGRRRCLSQPVEPGPAVLVRQGTATPHLLHRIGRVEIVALQERAAERVCQQRAKRRLAATADAHDDDDERRGRGNIGG